MSARNSKQADPRAVDIAGLARAGGQLGGALPLSTFERLRGLLLDAGDGVGANVDWSATGSQRPVAGGEPEIWLQLAAEAPVQMECQRCLQPVALRLSFERPLRFVRGEAEAARLDEDSEEDVLELRPRQDLLALIEDELILALPIVPRHENCKAPLAAEPDEAAPRHPFAGLAALRRKPQ